MTTKYASASYQEIYDLNTRDNKVTFLGIHTPTGSKPRQMLDGFFSQFRQFRYKGCRLTLQPCATLPVDPLGVSYGAGSQEVDAREMVNPIIFKGAHGESLGGVLNQMYKNAGFEHTGTSIDESGENDILSDPYNWAEQMYYAALSDKSFKKFGIQSTVQLNGLHPLVHKVAMNHPVLPNSSHPDRGKLAPATASPYDSGVVLGGNDKVWDGDIGTLQPPQHGLAQVDDNLFTNGMTSLGWLPTRSIAQYGVGQTQEAGSPNEVYSYMPKLMMGVLILPPCYSVKMYFRCVITHYFEFRQFTTALYGTNYLNSDYVDTMDGPVTAMTAIMANKDNTLESNAMDITPTTQGVF